MKIEKWTLGLAAAGLVTLSPGLLAQTQTPQLVPLQTALTATTISGYVDTSAVWNPGTGNANPAPYAFNAGKQDGFNIDSVDIKIAKDLDESQWSAGYTVELGFGPDAQAIEGAGAYPIRQAFVVLRAPVGNGLDFKLGRFDSILGYESSDSYKDPNWSRSYGYSFEPTEHTGLLASYKFCDFFSAEAGVANTVTTVGLNGRNDGGAATIESKKAFLGLLTFTAPDSFGFLKGSALYAGWDYGQGYSSTSYRGGFDLTTPASVPPTKPHDKSEIYVGATLNTPVTGLTLGASWDAIFHNDIVVPSSDVAAIGSGAVDTGYFQAIAGYISFKATDKLTLNGRIEYADGWGLAAAADANNTTNPGALTAPPSVPNPLDKVLAFTGTVDYKLWDNVITRLEFRWDTDTGSGEAFGGTVQDAPQKKNEVMIAANVIYKF